MTILLGREDKKAPAQFQKLLKAERGLNPYGEPNLRLVWSQSRLTWIEGVWTDVDPSGTMIREVYEARYRPKYWYIPPSWVVEKWLPAEMIYATPKFVTTEWDGKMVRELVTEGHGPYPSRGDWEYATHLVVPPDPTLLRYVAKAIPLGPPDEPISQACAMRDEDEAEQRQIESIQGDIIDDNWDAFRGTAHSVLDSTKQAYWPKEAK